MARYVQCRIACDDFNTFRNLVLISNASSECIETVTSTYNPFSDPRPKIRKVWRCLRPSHQAYTFRRVFGDVWGLIFWVRAVKVMCDLWDNTFYAFHTQLRYKLLNHVYFWTWVRFIKVNRKCVGLGMKNYCKKTDKIGLKLTIHNK